MSEFMKLKSPAVEGVSSGAGRLSETRLMFHSTFSASNQPDPKPTRGSDDVGSAWGAGSTAPATTGGGPPVSRDVAHPARNSVPIVRPMDRISAQSRMLPPQCGAPFRLAVSANSIARRLGGREYDAGLGPIRSYAVRRTKNQAIPKTFPASRSA